MKAFCLVSSSFRDTDPGLRCSIPNDEAAQSAPTGSDRRWRTPVRSTPRHGVSCAAASRRPRISAAPAARGSDDSCRPRSRTRPAPRSRLPGRAGTTCEPYRRRAKVPPRLPSNSSPIQQHERIAAPRQTMLDQAVASQLDQLRPFRRAQKSSANPAPSKNPSRRNWQTLFRLPSESGYIEGY